MISEDSEKRNDAIDFLLDGMKDVREIPQSDGTYTRELEFNPDIPWYKGHMINQPFGRYALFIKRVEHMAKQAYDNMCVNRAENICTGLLNIVEEHKRSVDGKSSETYKDENNNQQALIQLLSKNKQERLYTVKGDAKKSFMDGLLGRDGSSESED